MFSEILCRKQIGYKGRGPVWEDQQLLKDRVAKWLIYLTSSVLFLVVITLFMDKTRGFGMSNSEVDARILDTTPRGRPAPFTP